MFTFTPTPLLGVTIITPQVFGDERGFFMETYSEKEYKEHGITTTFVQDNHSKSKAGVLRGLHFQLEQPQAKLVHVIAGQVYDVAVDLRKQSPSYGKRFGIVLSSENKKQLFIPRGFAHGFLTLEDDTELVYKCDDFYHPTSENGILRNDTSLHIDWENYYTQALTISEKDKKNLTFDTFTSINPF